MPAECVRVATVTIQGANPNLQRDLDRGNLVWNAECDTRIELVASIRVNDPSLLVLSQTDCLAEGHEVSDEED